MLIRFMKITKSHEIYAFIYRLDFIMVNIIRKINSRWKNVFFDKYAKYTFTQKHIMML